MTRLTTVEFEMTEVPFWYPKRIPLFVLLDMQLWREHQNEDSEQMKTITDVLCDVLPICD